MEFGERPGAERRPCPGPRLVELDDHPARDEPRDRCFVGNGEPLGSARGDYKGLVPERIERPFDHGQPVALAVAPHLRRDTIATVILRTAIDIDRAGERHPAREPLDDVGVARRGEIAGSPFGREEKVVGVFPRDAMFPPRKLKAARHKGAFVEIEFAHLDGVLAAVRQRDEAQPLVGTKAVEPTHDPALAFGLVERIDVEHRGPVGIGVAVIRQCRAPHDPAEVIGVLPEIVDLAMDEARHGDAVLRAGNLQRLRVKRGIARVGLQPRCGHGIMLLDPRHRARRRDIFEPDVGIGIGLFCMSARTETARDQKT